MCRAMSWATRKSTKRRDVILAHMSFQVTYYIILSLILLTERTGFTVNSQKRQLTRLSGGGVWQASHLTSLKLHYKA